MVTIETYVPIRDDAGLKSLSVNERDFLRNCALSPKVLRDDGRRQGDLRRVRLKLGRWDNGAECTVQWGVGTRVTSLCTADLVPPSPDRPAEGMVNFSVDLSPMACSSFRQAPPSTTAIGVSRGPNFSDSEQRLLSNRILRCIERIILIGGALDTEALVLIPGKWVWRLSISLTVLDHGGNILDACVLATMAVLRHYRKPQVDLQEQQDETSLSRTLVLPTMIPSIVKEPTPLPLHHTPLSTSCALIPSDDAVNSSSSTSIVAVLVDPTDREELVQFGTLTIAMNIHSEVCLLDYGGGCELTPLKLKECCKLAELSIKQLCQMLEESLKEADEQARQERLQRLQQQQHEGLRVELPPLADDSPYQHRTDRGDTIMEVAEFADGDDSQVKVAQTEAEEFYRQQALDYARGHVAQAVRENDDPAKSSSSQQVGSLLAAMLKSAKQANRSSAMVGVQQIMIGSDLPLPEDRPQPKLSEPPNKLQHDASNNEPDMQNCKGENIGLSSANIMDLGSDEEETTAALVTEFQSLSKSSEKPPPGISKEVEKVDDFEIADLSMAIKKKKKSKSKKK